MNTVIDTDRGYPMPQSDCSQTIPQPGAYRGGGRDAFTAAATVRQALELLSRASADWRNGGGGESGPLHWPVAITLARSELRKALKALDGEKFTRRDCVASYGLDSLDTNDARAGLAWYNSATVTERRYWHHIARSAVPADAWEAYKAGGPQP